MTLEQVSAARRDLCSRKHCKELFQICSQCKGLISFSQDVISYGVVELKAAFVKQFPKVKLINTFKGNKATDATTTEIAPDGHGSKKKIVRYRITTWSGCTKTSARYGTVMHSKKTNLKEKIPSREKMNALCELATTEADHLLCKMDVCSELSGKEAQRRYGVQNFSAKQRKIEEAFRTASEIKQTFSELARVKEKAYLHALGFDYTSSDSEDENNDLEELEDVEWVSSSDDATKDEEESPSSDQLYSNAGQYDVDSLDHMSSFAKAVQEKTVSKEKGTSDRRVLYPDDTEM